MIHTIVGSFRIVDYYSCKRCGASHRGSATETIEINGLEALKEFVYGAERRNVSSYNMPVGWASFYDASEPHYKSFRCDRCKDED